MFVTGDGNAESRGDGCMEGVGDGSVKMEGDGNVELGPRAGEQRVEGGSDGGSIRDDLELDGNIPWAGTAPGNEVSYGQYRGFFGDWFSMYAWFCTSAG